MKFRIFQLIKEVFPDLTTHDAKQLTDTDRVQLASAIARQKGLTADQLEFVPVEY